MTTGRPKAEPPPRVTAPLAKAMRRQPTEAERILWRALRNQIVLSGTHFRRQVRLGRYIADFCCLAAKLVIEVDGEQHGLDDAQRRDAARTSFLEAQGFRVLRFGNADVLRNSDSVIETIIAAVGKSLVGQNAGFTPSPSQGGTEYDAIFAHSDARSS